MFGVAPPRPTALSAEHFGEKWSSRRFESPLGKNTALRSVPNVERGPGVLLQHLLQPKLISSIDRALTLKAGGHQLGDLAVAGDCHADHRPLRHGGVVFVALERARVLFDLQSNKDQGQNYGHRSNNLREIGDLFE